MSKGCTKCRVKGTIGGVKRKIKARVRGIGSVSQGEMEDLALGLLGSSLAFVVSRATLNPMFSVLFKTQLASGNPASYVKYTPGIFKALLGAFGYFALDKGFWRNAAGSLVFLGVQESIAAANVDLFGTPGARGNKFLPFLPADNITPLIYNGKVSGIGDYYDDGYPAVNGYDDVPALIMGMGDDELAQLSGMGDDELAQLAGTHSVGRLEDYL